MSNYTDTQLKQALAKMLPEEVEIDPVINVFRYRFHGDCVLDTELLHLCWMVEEGLNSTEHCFYFRVIENNIQEWLIEQDEKVGYGSIYTWSIHATWQQRTIALAKVKGVEIPK